MHRGLWRLAAAALAAGCGARSELAVPGPVASDDAGLACVHPAPSPDAFPAIERGCAVDADCDLARHQVDCCGSGVVVAFRRECRAAFDAAERAWTARHPATCTCPAITSGEDGLTGPVAAFDAVCVAGACASVAHVPCGWHACARDRLCLHERGGVGCDPPGPGGGTCVDAPASCRGAPTCGCVRAICGCAGTVTGAAGLDCTC